MISPIQHSNYDVGSMLAAFWVSWVGIFFDTAPWVLLWLVFEVVIYRRPHEMTYVQASGWQRRQQAIQHVLQLWDGVWYWQLIGVSAFALLSLLLPLSVNTFLGIAVDPHAVPDTLAVISAAILGVLTCARLLKQYFPNSGTCADGQCSVREHQE